MIRIRSARNVFLIHHRRLAKLCIFQGKTDLPLKFPSIPVLNADLARAGLIHTLHSPSFVEESLQRNTTIPGILSHHQRTFFWSSGTKGGGMLSTLGKGCCIIVLPCMVMGGGALALPLMALGLGGYALLGTRPGRAFLGVMLQQELIRRLFKYQRSRKGPHFRQSSIEDIPFSMGLPQFFKTFQSSSSALPFVSGPFQGLLGFLFNSTIGAISNQQQTMDHIFRSVLSGLAKNSEVLKRFGGMVNPQGATKFSQTIINGQSRITTEFMVIGRNQVPGTVRVSAVGSQLPNDYDGLHFENVEVTFPSTGEVFNITGSLKSKQKHYVDATFRVKK